MNDNEREKIEAQMAGYLLSSWLPRDNKRKVIMLIIFLIAVFGFLMGRSSSLFLLLVLPLFSPRLVGESVYFAGKIMRLFK